MRRADRLFQIVNVLRRRRTATTAKHLAERLGVSERAVYRDIRDLLLAGTPIDGEAGVGYRIRPGYDLPPLMFDRDEIQALVLGARIVRQFGDPEDRSGPSCPRQPRRAASMVATSIFFIGIIAAKARLASAPPAASASVSTRGVICHERPQRSLHQPH